MVRWSNTIFKAQGVFTLNEYSRRNNDNKTDCFSGPFGRNDWKLDFEYSAVKLYHFHTSPIYVVDISYL